MSYHNDRGTICSPWLAFGDDWDTGISIRGGKLAFSLDGILVPFEEWSTACIRKGHITAVEVALFRTISHDLEHWQPPGGWEIES